MDEPNLDYLPNPQGRDDKGRFTSPNDLDLTKTNQQGQELDQAAIDAGYGLGIYWITPPTKDDKK